MNSVSFGNPDETWAKHNITQYPVDYNKAKSNWKASVFETLKQLGDKP
jgi:hypothetical protein